MSETESPDGMLRRWIDPQPVEVPPDFEAAIGGHPLVAQILTRRGIQDLAAVRAFLDPDAYTPTAPEEMPGVERACARIELAIEQAETICVWGDFDVDGQTSTTLLVSALRGLGANVVYHIPVRAREGHGINIEHLRPILDDGASLLVTCDTGISAHEALDFVRERGCDAIVTDHHSLPETLPDAYALINPRLLPDDHPFTGLPGVGIAYLLVDALYRRAGREAETQDFLDLVAMGIVADIALQTADTRYLLQRGLPVLRSAKRTGLQAMYELSSLQPEFMTEEHIGFVIGPRMNALGRLDDANPAVELLTTTDLGRARVLATHLEGLNARRRLLTSQVLRAAQDQIERDSSLLEQAVLVLAHPEWPAGVVGIVASELVERYNRPTILLTAPPDQLARGSARSIEGVNITAAIASQKHLLHGYGGHPMAAGLSLDPSNLTAFRHGISRYVEKVLGGAPPRPTLPLDGIINLSDISMELVNDLERLSPFGAGNPPLILCVPRLTVLSSSTIGHDGNHLQVMVKDENDQTRRVLWWGGADWPLPEGVFDLACVLRASNYRGQRDVQLEWVDARPLAPSALELRRAMDVIDQRGIQHPIPALQSFIQPSETDDTIIWAEGDARERLKALGYASCDRTQLYPAKTLILWTTPPDRAVLDSALDLVEPKTVVIFGVDPSEITLEAFLKRLAGLVKYTLERMDGKAALSRLAAASAQRETTVMLGLEWMEQRGMVKLRSSENGKITLEPGAGASSTAENALTVRLQTILSESTAYRQYFHAADKENLL